MKDLMTRIACPSAFLQPYAALVLCCLALAGCATPTGIKLVQTPVSALDVENVLVATSRVAGEGGDFTGDRSRDVSYASYAVSIPPNHKVGEIEWPSRAPDPKRHFAVATAKSLADDVALKIAINGSLVAPNAHAADERREVVLFIHGYNTDFSEALYRAAQMKHDFDMAMPFILFSWPSAGKPELYIYDRDSVKASRDQLAGVIELLGETKADRLTIVAHSLGTELLMETLRQIALGNDGRLPGKLDSVILMSPDLDMDVFNNQLEAIERLPEDFVIFVSEHDKALQLSSFLAGDMSRLGNTLDETKIRREGITVIDVSAFEGGDELQHMTAVTSPSLVAVLKGIAHSGNRHLLSQQTEQSSLPEMVVDTATLPLKLVIKSTEAIFDQ